MCSKTADHTYISAGNKTNMSDYFDEMGWQPVDADQIQRHQTLLVARFLMENGIFGDDFDAQSLAPPASRRLVAELPVKRCTAGDEPCAICLKPNDVVGEDDDGAIPAEEDDAGLFKVLPCTHAFHCRCILPWLEKVGIECGILYVGFWVRFFW